MSRTETAQSPDSPFAAKLIEAQDEAGVRSEDVARELGVSLRTYTYWRQGREPKPAQRMAVARYFNKPLAWFFEDTNGKAA